MEQDSIYARRLEEVLPFAFDKAVVAVFDDMITRSIPGYGELIRSQAALTALLYREGTCMYDLGASTGNLEACLLDTMKGQPFVMVAADSSPPMIAALQKKIAGRPGAKNVHPVCIDIRDLRLANASVVVANFTLQFLPPADRGRIVAAVYDALVPGGVLLLSEKVMHEDPVLDRLQQDFYHRFKRENGYSELEIRQKRDALEEVLIPETADRHRQRLADAGFTAIDIWRKWFNFAAWICRKAAA